MLRSAPLSTRSSESAPAAPRAIASPRSEWVDAAKGMGIVLVVAGHALIGLVDAGLLAADSALGRTHYLIYSFHMPLFFLLSGLFVQPRLQRDAPGFLRAAFVRVAWPYLLWCSLQSLLIASLPGLVNRSDSFDAARFVALLWEPAAQFWFLQSLFALQLLAWLLLPRVGAPALLALCVALRVLPELVTGLPVALVQVLRFAPFFALGAWLGPVLVRRELRAPLAAGLALLAFAAWLVAAETARAQDAGYWSAAALPAALAGSVGLIALAQALRGPFAAAWAALGRASMAIFVLHVLFVAGVRIALHKGLGLGAPAVVLPLALAAGIAGPLAARELALRWRVARIVGLQ
jgi:fucose 4-O-acetylase-like acetyltransferase